MNMPYDLAKQSNISGIRDNLSRGYIKPELNQEPAHLSDLTSNMTSYQLFLMADFFESQSMAIRARAVCLAHHSSQSASIDARVEYVAVEGPRAVRRFLRQGKAIHEAIASAAAVTGIRRDAVEWHWTHWCRLRTDAQRAQRDNLMYDMAQVGLSDATIGKAVRLHEKSVARLLKSLRKKRGLVRARTFIGHKHAEQAQNNGTACGLEAASGSECLPCLPDQHGCANENARGSGIS